MKLSKKGPMSGSRLLEAIYDFCNYNFSDSSAHYDSNEHIYRYSYIYKNTSSIEIVNLPKICINAFPNLI